MSLLDSLVKISAGVAEAGLLAIDSTIRTAQSAIGNAAGIAPPNKVDDAVSELAGRALRILQSAAPDPGQVSTAAAKLAAAALDCFKFIDPLSPRSLTLPLEVPLSVGTLLTQSGLRGLSGLSVAGPSRFPALAGTAAAAFSGVLPRDSSSAAPFLVRTPSAPGIDLRDVAARAGLATPAGRSQTGIAVFDINNNGYLDIAVANAEGGVSLLRNNGNGTFTDVSAGSSLDACAGGFSIAAGDYNNDGLTDLYITRSGFASGQGRLYRNNGDGTFTDATAGAGVACSGPASAACWVDYDCDGRLDLFVANNIGGLFDRTTRNRLFHNNGNGTFTEVAFEAGIKSIWPALGACWGDFNNDGFPDLFLSNAIGRSQLFRNNGDGTFTDVSAKAGIDEHALGSAAAFVDFDNDGWLDLVQFLWSDPRGGLPLKLWRNNRDGTFRRIADRGSASDRVLGTLAGTFGDLANRGSLDIALGSAAWGSGRVEPLVLLNGSAGGFEPLPSGEDLPGAGPAGGVAAADLFGDGRLCLLAAGGSSGLRCYAPRSLPGNYLNVRLRGVASNRSAIGARIMVEAGGRAQHRAAGGGELHFGLGGVTHVDAVEVWWPSGLRQRLVNIPGNRSIVITEGESHWSGSYRGVAAGVEMFALT